MRVPLSNRRAQVGGRSEPATAFLRGENCGHRITRVEGTEGKRRVSIALETNLVERRADTVRTFLRAEKCERRSIESMAIGNASESKRVRNAGYISNAS